MITYVNKDITTVESGLIIQGVNCQGVMGSGVAAAIREKWSEVYTEYCDFCDATTSTKLLGQVNFVRIDFNLYVANCFTQLYYGRDNLRYADPAAIQKCLIDVYDWCATNKVYDIYTVPIGCGLGGLDWKKDVLPIFDTLEPLKNPAINITVCDIY